MVFPSTSSSLLLRCDADVSTVVKAPRQNAARFSETVPVKLFRQPPSAVIKRNRRLPIENENCLVVL